jgi:integrase/recombinase XerD
MTDHYIFREPAADSITGRAIRTIDGFGTLLEEFRRKMIINGYSMSTYTNYIRCVALLCLNYGTLPENISDSEIDMFLLDLKMNKKPSESYFKQTVGSISTLYRLTLNETRKLKMPRIPRKETLPIVLSKKELRSLFLSINYPKHQLLFMLIYSAGLRSSEVCALRWSDIDFDLMKIFVRAGKNRHDRYVVLSPLLAKALWEFGSRYNAGDYVFYGHRKDLPMARGTVQVIFRNYVRKSGIRKKISPHTLRHCFATHLMEDGIDLFTIKEQLGHVNIRHTIKYIHIVECKKVKAHSPLDTLFRKKKIRKLFKAGSFSGLREKKIAIK